jgi:R3H domain
MRFVAWWAASFVTRQYPTRTIARELHLAMEHTQQRQAASSRGRTAAASGRGRGSRQGGAAAAGRGRSAAGRSSGSGGRRGGGSPSFGSPAGRSERSTGNTFARGGGGSSGSSGRGRGRDHPTARTTLAVRGSRAGGSSREQLALPPRRDAPTLKNGDKGADAHTVSEGYRIRLTRTLMELRENDAQTSLEFPSTLTNTERKFVHELSQKLGLKSKSRGTGDDRYICVTKPSLKKKSVVAAPDEIPKLYVGARGLEALQRHMVRYPPSHDEALDAHETGSALRQALLQTMSHNNSANLNDDDNTLDIMARLDELGLGGHRHEVAETRRYDRPVNYRKRQAFHAQAQQAKLHHRSYAKLQQSRAKLPAYSHSQRIVETVAAHSVTIISGDTGCGQFCCCRMHQAARMNEATNVSNGCFLLYI